VPLCCEGTIGAGVCSAVMAEVAESPGPADAIDWGRTAVIPETGSVLDAGHSPRGAFFRAQVGPSPAGEGVTPFVCEGAGDIVAADAVDASEEDEFERCTVLRGMNILKSSPLAPLGTPLGPLHPCRAMF
jgi:hypothetical protein